MHAMDHGIGASAARVAPPSDRALPRSELVHLAVVHCNFKMWPSCQALVSLPVEVLRLAPGLARAGGVAAGATGCMPQIGPAGTL